MARLTPTISAILAALKSVFLASSSAFLRCSVVNDGPRTGSAPPWRVRAASRPSRTRWRVRSASGFVLFGAGSGLMNVPLTNAVLGSMPAERSGMASALLNNSREVAGLLGITVIGAVLRSRQGVALSHGVLPAPAFLDGYHAGLAVTIVLVAAGVIISYAALRRVPSLASRPVPAGDVPVLADGEGPGPAAGPELAGRRS